MLKILLFSICSLSSQAFAQLNVTFDEKPIQTIIIQSYSTKAFYRAQLPPLTGDREMAASIWVSRYFPRGRQVAFMTLDPLNEETMDLLISLDRSQKYACEIQKGLAVSGNPDDGLTLKIARMTCTAIN